jgi:hypothetical protein
MPGRVGDCGLQADLDGYRKRVTRIPSSAVFSLSWTGSGRVTPGEVDAVTTSAGDAWLMEDTTGSGHTTEVISLGPFEALVIQLPNDALLMRP